MNGLDPHVWNLVTPYLDQALDLEPEQLRTWLDNLAVTQPRIAVLVRDLMAELESLNAAGFLAEPIITNDLTKLNVLRFVLGIRGR